MAATNSLQSLHHHNHRINLPLLHPTTSSTTTNFLKPSTKLTTSTSSVSSLSVSAPKTTSSGTVFSSSSTTTSTSATSTAASAAASSTSLDLLATLLAAQDFRQADEETRRLLIALAGEASVKRGYVFFSEAQFISTTSLKAIDELWRQHSNNKFGYSVQKAIWEQKCDKDFSKFFIRVGWVKKLDTEVLQYNYRAFPNEFIWELTPETPVGHLPLTNALRGTQLLSSVLSHPAFDDVEGDVDLRDGGDKLEDAKALLGTSKPLSKKVFKSDYSF